MPPWDFFRVYNTDDYGLLFFDVWLTIDCFAFGDFTFLGEVLPEFEFGTEASSP